MAASQSSDDVEILVHVTAPSRVTDDASYRQLAQAYLSFKPHALIALPTTPQQGDDDVVGETTQLAEREDLTPQATTQDFTTMTSGQLMIPESQDLSFQSALDNRSSPPLRDLEAEPHERAKEPASSQSASWCAPPSQISDSYPLPDARLLQVTPTRVLEKYLSSFQTSSALEPSSPCQKLRNGRAAPSNPQEVDIPSSIPIPDLENDLSQSLRHVDTRKIIPVTPHPRETAVRKKREPVQDMIDETHIPSSAISNTPGASHSRSESAPPASKRQKSISDEVSSLNLLRSSSDTGPAGRQRPNSSASAVKEFAHVLELRPPSPPIGVADIEPTSLISAKLAKLAGDLSSRYRPISKRTTDPFERGYWLLDCSSWNQDIRLDAWVFLAKYLQSGLAGWGVWCRRDSSHDWIRLYCWAHVAKHTYLLLYLASGRHMKLTGAQWLDADGEVVLDVPPIKK